MKKTLLALSLIVSLGSTTLMAQTDSKFLFTNEAVTFDYISADEMAVTEGQLFGMSSADVITVSRKALNMFRPVLNDFLNGSKRDGVLRLLDLWTTFQLR